MWLTWAAIAFAVVRILIGLAPVLAPRASVRLTGFPSEHDNPTARLMGRLFGVRDIALGVLVASFLSDRELLRWTFLFNLAVDLADAAVIAIPLVRRQGIDRGAGLSIAFALTGATGWAVLWFLSR
jgi:uncharacterized protein YjeT (DUF2065 family)